MYFGPYIEVHVERGIVEVDKCENKTSCPNSSTPFCPLCGIVSATRFYKTEKAKILWSDDEGLDEDLALLFDFAKVNNTLFYIPNKEKGRVLDGWNIESHSRIELSDSDIEDDSICFSKNFEKAIKILKTSYGTENCTIKYGILNINP